MIKAIKELIIMLAVCFLAVGIFVVTLYKYIPNRKPIPGLAEYSTSEEIKDLMEDTIDSTGQEDEVAFTYEVTADDLKGYQSTNTYVPGKSNPFAPYVGEIDDENVVDANTVDGENKVIDDENTTIENATPPNVYTNKGTK